jgi:hypothetical protein
MALPALLVSGYVQAAAQVPLPRPKPPAIAKTTPASVAPEAPVVSAPAAPSACLMRLRERGVILSAVPDIAGPGECGATDVVRVEALVNGAGNRVALTPHATLRCATAETLAAWIREDVAPTLEVGAARLTAMSVDASFECRGRNRVAGAKISQHGFGNAIDVSGFTLTGGKSFKLNDPAADKEQRAKLRDTACARFTTVLGPGSDGYHEHHIHLDIIERRGGYRLCQWDIREPKDVEIAAVDADAEGIPMPRPRPISAPPKLAESNVPLKKPEPPPRRRGRAGQ